MKEDLIKFLKKELKFKTKIDFEKLVETPKNQSHGDFAFPVFILSKELGKNPVEIAKDLEQKLNKKLPDFLQKIQAIGPFLNFTINNQSLTKDLGKKPSLKVSKPQKILIEYPSPNTNKSLHIGHVRNILLGNSLGIILEKTGNTVIRTNLNNDRGIAICKAMLGYQYYFSDKTPESMNMKPDEFVGMCYVEFEKKMQNNYELEQDSLDCLVKWEMGDKRTRDLWIKILNWVYDGYSITYRNLKLPKFDQAYFESEIYDKGKKIVEDAVKKKIKGFEKDKTGAIYYDFKNKTYGKKYLMRGDGTTIYITQDLYLAQLKKKQFKADKYIFIVGKEQEYHFQVLFQLIDKLGIADAKNNVHYAYGYVYDKNGKKFSSRKGNAVRADGLIELVEEKARENLLNKELTKNLPQKELEKRSKIIGFAALAFGILNTNPVSDMKFDIDKALAFEGETGPYVQYTYARIQSIFRKEKPSQKIHYSFTEDIELKVIKKLLEYEHVVVEASEKLKPSLIANYVIKLCQLYNEFYQNYPILKAEEKVKQTRLRLSENVAEKIKDSLELLGIETLDEM